MESDKEKISKFLFHLGKGLWKSIPILGPIIDEVFYEQFKAQIIARVDSLSSNDTVNISNAIPTIDFESLDNKLRELTIEMQTSSMSAYTSLLKDITLSVDDFSSQLDQLHDSIFTLTELLSSLSSLKANISKNTQLDSLIESLQNKREQWIRRLSNNQRLLLRSFPITYSHIQHIWNITKLLIPNCGYKEFRFRLHELEWLGLIERYWNNQNNSWHYRISSDGIHKRTEEEF